MLQPPALRVARCALRVVRGAQRAAWTADHHCDLMDFWWMYFKDSFSGSSNGIIEYISWLLMIIMGSWMVYAIILLFCSEVFSGSWWRFFWIFIDILLDLHGVAKAEHRLTRHKALMTPEKTPLDPWPESAGFSHHHPFLLASIYLSIYPSMYLSYPIQSKLI